jgi:hypothetical protein
VQAVWGYFRRLLKVDDSAVGIAEKQIPAAGFDVTLLEGSCLALTH